MFLAYSLLFSFGLLLATPYYLWRNRGKSLPSAYWRERLGFLPESFQQPARSAREQSRSGALWVHAVSLGETLAVAPLILELQRRDPKRKIFISHVTPAGREAGEARLPGLAGHFYLPLDWRWAVRRVFRRLQPATLLIVETELWPNLLRLAHEYKARVVLVNARLSGSSFRGYRLFRPFVRRVLENLDWIFAQTPRDAERFQFLGARPERIVVVGNMKFDGNPPQLGELPGRLNKALRYARRGPVLVAASTMSGEEAVVLEAWDEVRRQHPQALLILAPRHPARFDQVAQLLTGQGRSFVRRTALETADQELASQLASPEVLLLNTIGELAGIFEIADVVFMGGSLVPTGGHNLLEPAFWSKPILFGPHMDNFRDTAALFLEGRAAIQIRDQKELARALLELLGDGDLRIAMGQMARRILERESGATSRIVGHLSTSLEGGAAERASVAESEVR